MAEAIKPQSALCGARVLVVEDEVIVALALTQVLIDHGCTVVGPAPTVRQALSVLQQERPDLALLDVNLRGELVTPVAAKLFSWRVPFVLVTGQEVVALPAPELRRADCVPKPIIEEVLVRTMVGALQEAC